MPLPKISSELMKLHGDLVSYFSVLPNCLLIIHGTLQRQAESVDFDRCSLNHDEQKTTERKSSSLKSKQYQKRMRVKKRQKNGGKRVLLWMSQALSSFFFVVWELTFIKVCVNIENIHLFCREA